jgi:hypothetical protein
MRGSAISSSRRMDESQAVKSAIFSHNVPASLLGLSKSTSRGSKVCLHKTTSCSDFNSNYALLELDNRLRREVMKRIVPVRKSSLMDLILEGQKVLTGSDAYSVKKISVERLFDYIKSTRPHLTVVFSDGKQFMSRLTTLAFTAIEIPINSEFNERAVPLAHRQRILRHFLGVECGRIGISTAKKRSTRPGRTREKRFGITRF